MVVNLIFFAFDGGFCKQVDEQQQMDVFIFYKGWGLSAKLGKLEKLTLKC